jgi:glycosyltransferase involved in cell wall biosynthesis
MRGAIAECLVLAFSEGVSLELWAQTGLLEREWALYRRLRPWFARMIIVSYGDAGDRKHLDRLGGRVGLVCNEARLGPAEYAAALPGLVLEQAGPAASALVKTNQMSGGEAALAITSALRRAGKKVGLVARGGYLWSQFAAWEQGPASPAAVAAGDLEGRLCRAADMVVGTTRQMIDDLAWRHGVPESRLAVVPNYVLPEDVPGPGARAPAVILFAGRLAPQKRVDRLIEAVSRLRDDLKRRVTLSIIGAGPLEASLREQAASLSVNAVFEPRLAHDELMERMRRCTVYAQTSSYEGHPKTIIEAMSVGAAVVVTDTPGLRGIVRHGLSGLCVPPEAESIAMALEGLLEDEPWRRTMGAAAAAQTRSQYGLEYVAELEAAVYRRALAGPAEASRETAGAVTWDEGLSRLEPSRMVDAWARSARSFVDSLDGTARVEFLSGLEGVIRRTRTEAEARLMAQAGAVRPASNRV